VAIEIVLVPIAGYYILRLVQYNEGRRLESLRQLIEIYNKQLLSLYNLQESELPKLEQELLANAKELRQTKPGFSLFESFIELDKIIDFITVIHKKAYSKDFSERGQAERIMEQAIETFDALNDNEMFAEAIEDFGAFWDKLKFLVSQYKERMSLTEELRKIEEAYLDEKNQPSYVPK